MDQAYIVYSSPFTGLACYWAPCPQSRGSRSGGPLLILTRLKLFDDSILLSLKFQIILFFYFIMTFFFQIQYIILKNNASMYFNVQLLHILRHLQYLAHSSCRKYGLSLRLGKLKPMQRCLKPAFFLLANRGRLHGFSKRSQIVYTGKLIREWP